MRTVTVNYDDYQELLAANERLQELLRGERDFRCLTIERHCGIYSNYRYHFIRTRDEMNVELLEYINAAQERASQITKGWFPLVLRGRVKQIF